MKIIPILMTLFSTLIAQADLLEKIKIEDAINSRVQETMKSLDSNARVQIQFQYNNFKGTLPGMSVSDKDTFSPNKIEASDIARINIQIFSKFTTLSDEVMMGLYSQIPVDRSRISVKLIEVKPVIVEVPVPIQAKDLNEIVDKTISSLGKIFLALLGLCMCLFIGNSFFQTRKKLMAMREQMSLLTTAVSENGGAPAMLPQLAGSPFTPDFLGSKNNNGSGNTSLVLEHFSANAIEEIFADCYWTHEDEYAHWLWQNLTNIQKRELLLAQPFTRAYALHFINLKAQEKNYHNHPSYLQPLEICNLSEEDLAVAVRKTPALFHHLSSLRQQGLPLTFEEKLKALNATPVANLNWKNDKKSELRSFAPQMQWGHLSEKDESVLFRNSEIVPSEIKENISSLVWLAQRDDEYIREVLGKYDAKALSTAWIAPPEVLQKLEAFLPEKKLKNLQASLQKNAPNKNSVIFLNLVREGLKNDAA